jgi:hypothetical protein
MKRSRRGLSRSDLTFIVFALAAIVLAAFQLQRSDDGLTVTRINVGNTPATIFRSQSGAAAPAVVIAHGFAGSQQLMQPFALTLARNGYVVVTFDFLGHGRNPEPMRGDITKETGITEALLAELGQVADVARALPQSDGRLAVLGHSMASDIVVKYAMAHPNVQATVAVSVFSKVATAVSPRNLLVIVGALEPAMLRDEGLRIVGLTAGGPAEPDKTYGDFGNGNARRMVEARGVEHIGVLYGQDSLNAARDWLNRAFTRRGADFIDMRGRWLALLFAGIVALAWPLSRLLPTVGVLATDSRWNWGRLLLAAIAPALLTPLILWKLPTDFLAILLGDYLTLHFLVYGALTGAALVLLRSRGIPNRPLARKAWPVILAAALAIGAFNIVAFGVPIDSWFFSFWPIAPRWPIIAVIACGAVPYFVADETLTAEANRTGGYALTKFCFLVSLAIAILLNPAKLFFLAIIVPAVLLLFLIFGVISRFSLRATGHPLPGALGNAAMFAWAIGVTFPMVVR